MTYLWLIPVVLLMLAWGMAALRRRQLADLKEYESHVREFREAVHPIVQDDETPSTVLEFLQFMNAKVVDRRAAGDFYRYVASGRMNPIADQEYRKDSNELRAFLKRRPELEPSFGKAAAHGLLAVSYLSFFWGRKVRVWLAALDTVERQEEVAYTYHDIDSHNGAQPAAA